MPAAAGRPPWMACCLAEPQAEELKLEVWLPAGAACQAQAQGHLHICAPATGACHLFMAVLQAHSPASVLEIGRLSSQAEGSKEAQRGVRQVVLQQKKRFSHLAMGRSSLYKFLWGGVHSLEHGPSELMTNVLKERGDWVAESCFCFSFSPNRSQGCNPMY